MLPPPEFIPDSVFHQRALALLQEHERKSGSPISLPVPIEAIVEQTLGLQVVCIPLEEGPGEIILARIDPDFRGRPTIQLNDKRIEHFDEFFGTEQFSLAHEVGHWMLHLGRGRSRQLSFELDWSEQIGESILCRRMTAGDRREFQAERFAALLLLPEYLLTAVAENYDLTHWSGLAAVARDCGVSKRAMTRRLGEIGLIPTGPDGDEHRQSKMGRFPTI